MIKAIATVIAALVTAPLAFAQFTAIGTSHSIRRTVYVYNSSSTNVIAPVWARRAYVRAWGAGGGAGGSTSSVLGGRGGSGGYVSLDTAVKGGAVAFNIVVGKGGDGGPRVSNVGKGGGGGSVTSVNSPADLTPFIRAAGGGGGGGASPGGASAGGGGGAAGPVAEAGRSPCANPTVGCASAGSPGVRGQSSGGAAGVIHGSCSLLGLPNTWESTAGTVGSDGHGGQGGTCFAPLGGVPSNQVPGDGKAYYDDNATTVCTPGAGGAGSPGGGGGGIEATTNVSCPGGGGGVNYVHPTNARVRSGASGSAATPPLDNDVDLKRTSAVYATGGLAELSKDGANGSHGLVVIYWY